MVSLINAYAPIMTSSTEEKDELYDDLGLTLRDMRQQESVFLLGHINARVGSDHSSWPSFLGQFVFGKMNESGQHLLEFCCRHDLCINNSFFDTKPKVNFQPRKIHRLKKERRPSINVNKTRDLLKVEEFTAVLVNDLPVPPCDNASERWLHLRSAIFNNAFSTFGKRQNQSADWFQSSEEELLHLVEEKKRALSSYKNLPSERNLKVLRTARNRVQQTARRCANDHWHWLSSIQTATIVGNIRGIYQTGNRPYTKQDGSSEVSHWRDH
ncbi:uncharacterized protein [Procambarus clarkii]|uniref:uncharacterized protein n=1 Tax=Procambarus clarkii TaxID=6728 RepID=UPI003742C4E8